MVERIAVYYSAVADAPVIGQTYHMTIVYSDSAGRSYSASAGPQIPDVPQTATNVIAAAAAVTTNAGSPYGTLVASPTNGQQFTISPVDGITHDEHQNPYQSEIVATGNDLASQWNTILTTYTNVSNLGLVYSPASQNSNNLAGTALRAADLPLPPSADHLAPGEFAPLPTTLEQFQLFQFFRSFSDIADGPNTDVTTSSRDTAGDQDTIALRIGPDGRILFDQETGTSSNGQRSIVTRNEDGSTSDSDYNNNGQLVRAANYDSNDNLTSASGINASGATWSEDGQNGTFTYNGQQYSGPTLASGAGLTLGSTIGGILGGNSIAGRVAGAAVIGTLGQSVGSILSRSGLGTALLGNGSLDPSLLDSAVSSAVADFGGNLAPNAIGAVAGTFSSLLFGEAAQALGLHGFAGGLFTTIGTSITSQLAMNLGSMALNAIGLTNNFAAGSFVGNISGAVGGYFGSYLANEIVPATGIASSIGGRIGGAIGGFLASEIPVVGTFFGSLVGSVLGTLVGGLFDPHIVPWSSEMVGAVNGVLGINYWNWNGGGNPQEFTSLANMVAGNANQVLALTRRDPNIMNITGLTSINELVFNQLGSTLTAIYPDGNSTNFYVNGMPQWFALQALYNTSEIATYELVQHAVLVGSDPIVTGALAAARVQDTTTPAVYADLRVAQDYGITRDDDARTLSPRGRGCRDEVATGEGAKQRRRTPHPTRAHARATFSRKGRRGAHGQRRRARSSAKRPTSAATALARKSRPRETSVPHAGFEASGRLR